MDQRAATRPKLLKSHAVCSLCDGHERERSGTDTVSSGILLLRYHPMGFEGTRVSSEKGKGQARRGEGEINK